MDLAIADKDRAKVVAEQRRTDNLVERLISFQVYHRDVAPRLIGDIETGQSNDLSAPSRTRARSANRGCYCTPLPFFVGSVHRQSAAPCYDWQYPLRSEGTPLASRPI
jgi:hypothetical protein